MRNSGGEQGGGGQVDIVIPTYNRASLLPETLKSVQNQSYPYWRCWIAEDGETPATLDALQPFLEDERFRYLPGKHTGAPAAPRNRAIQGGNAGYIAFLDDDDLWRPEKLEHQVEFMTRHPGCVLLGCNAYRWPGAEEWTPSLPLYFKKKDRFGKVAYPDLVQDNYFITSSVLIRRTVLKESGLFSETIPPPIEDYELWLRISALGEAWLMPEPLVLYRENVSTFYPKLDRRQSYQLKAKIFEFALEGVAGTESPLSHPERGRYAAACRRERDFYLAGPRFLGRFRHEILSKIRNYLSFPL